MPFVQAKCPNCGGFLAVDNEKDAAICQFCGTPFIVEKAIYNYTINGNISVANANVSVTGGPTVDSLVARAKQFDEAKEYEKAIEYFNRVLDLEPNNLEANQYLKRYSQPPTSDNLFVSRGSSFLACAAACNILIDGKVIGSVGNGKTASFSIMAGKHIISFMGSKDFLKIEMSPTPFFLPTVLNHVNVYFKYISTGVEVELTVD